MSQIFWLEDTNFIFPDVSFALSEPDGLLAASEKLTPELVVEAYKRGIFPWYSEGQPVLWWSPEPRCVLYPEKFHVSRSFRRTLNSNPFKIKTDSAFREVMLACAEPRTEPGAEQATDTGSGDKINESENAGTWITQAMLEVYCQLHEKGFAHSIECWTDNKLVGGMYGLVLGDIFFGESMFSKKKDASKVAMYYLCTKIRPFLVDAQVYSDHLQTLGADTIPRSEFIALVQSHLNNSLNI
jgi:leucyl/phenylalanyl-tRNA--protein transferase